MNVAREPISPNARNWWKLMNGMDPDAPPPPPPPRPPCSEVVVDDIDSVPSKDYSMELKHSNTLMSDDGVEEEDHVNPHQKQFIDTTETLHHNDGIDLKSPEQPIAAVSSLPAAYYRVGPRSGTQSQASRIKDKIMSATIHHKHIQNRQQQQQQQYAIKQEEEVDPPASPDEEDAFDEILKEDPPREEDTTTSSSKLFHLWDSTAVCGGATTASISSPTMQQLESTAEGWGRLDTSATRTQSPMDITTNTVGGQFEYDNDHEEDDDSFFETDYIRRRTASLKQARQYVQQASSDFANFESIETEVVEGKDGSYQQARVYCPDATNNDDEDSLFDQLSHNYSAEEDGDDYAYEIRQESNGENPAEIGIEIHRERTYHSVFESIKEESEGDFSDLSSIDNEIGTGGDDVVQNDMMKDGEEDSAHDSNPPVSKLLQTTRTRTELSALTEDSSTTYNTDANNNHESKGCFLTPKLVRKLRNSKAHEQSSALQRIPTAPTASSSVDEDSLDEMVRRTDSCSSVHRNSQEVTKGLLGDNSLFSKQYEENSHHSYVAYYERGEASVSSIRVIDQPTPDNFPALNSEVVVRVDYSTVSLTDCCLRKGQYWGDNSDVSPKLPIVPGTSFVGTIVQLTRPAMRAGLRVGDCVTSLVQTGANSRHLLVSKDRLVKIPKGRAHHDLPKLACLPEVALGCFQALHAGQKNAARYRPMSLGGKHILVIDGASVYGSCLVELARAAGATSVYVTAKKSNFQSIKDVGGVPLEMDPKYWFSILKGRIDMVIGLSMGSSSASKITTDHMEVLTKKKGKMVILTPPGGINNQCPPESKKIKTEYVNVFDDWESDPKQAKKDLTHLVGLVNDETLNPHVIDSISLDKVMNAHAGLKAHGFVLCDPWMLPTHCETFQEPESSFTMEELEFDLD